MDSQSQAELTFLLDRFEEQYAVLRNEVVGEIRWPIRQFPKEVKIGDELILQIASGQSETEKYKIQRRLLEELIN